MRQGLEFSETDRAAAFCAHTVQTSDALVVPDVRLDDRFRGNPLVIGPPNIISYVGVPLQTPSGHNIGSLCVIDRRPRDFSGHNLELLANFASLVMGEMELRHRANVDSLTEAYSRSGLIGAAHGVIAECRRTGRPATLLLFDLDHFKAINDRFGHAGGDAVLKAVARSCREAMRPGDVLGRIGGEEFVVLLKDVGADRALAVAERFRATVAASKVTGVDVRVTASFGVAALTNDVLTPEHWLAIADRRLYSAKASGRDICCAE